MTTVRLMRLAGALIAAAFAAGCESVAYEQAYGETPVGQAQVRTLPAARWIEVRGDGAYFDESDRLFGRLFDYIRSNEISMTVPVESELEPAAMRFFLGPDAPADVRDAGAVRVVEIPQRRVASLAAEGRYSAENVGRVRGELEAWVAADAGRARDGDGCGTYAVFWNGPFTPWFMKRFEVHLPVRAAR